VNARGVRPSFTGVGYALPLDVRARTIDICAPGDPVCDMSPTVHTPNEQLAYLLTHSAAHVYAYAFGHLLALSVYGRYEEVGEGFADSYLELLKAGGSMPPEQLGEIVGVDLTDPGFWNAGIDLIERQLDMAEEIADS
jgi:hypothetical protein